MGPHRLYGKIYPYEESLHVPLIVRLPRRMRGSHGAPRKLGTTVANIDVAPTILRLAEAKPCNRAGKCRMLDGRSLLRAIRSHGRRWPHDREILLELDGARAGALTPCNYRGVRTSDQLFVHYLGATQTRDSHGPCLPDDEFEHYELRSDPFQLSNVYPAAPGTAAADEERLLARRLTRLRDCAGIRGRDPEPASGHYCD